MKEDPKIEHVLKEIDHYARLVGIHVFAVGGFARNKILNKPHPITSDIDLMADDWGGIIKRQSAPSRTLVFDNGAVPEFRR